jgi:membrane protein
MWNFFGLIAHYCARLKRVLDEPAGNKTENISYKLIRKFVRFILLSLREKYKESVKKFGYFLGTLIFVALTISFLWPLGYVISLLCVGISSLRGDFSQFDRYYAIFEVSMNFYIVPPMIYLIVVLLFAHMIGVFFRRMHDYDGYSIKWVYGGYIKMLGNVTVVAILIAIIMYALLAVGTGYNSSYTLADYITWTVFTVSICGSYCFFIKAFYDTKSFFTYPSMGILFSIFCVGLSLYIFDNFFGGDLLDIIAKVGNSGHADAFLERVQKILVDEPKGEPEEYKRKLEDFKKSLLESHLWLDKNDPNAYGVALRVIKNILLVITVVFYALVHALGSRKGRRLKRKLKRKLKNIFCIS